MRKHLATIVLAAVFLLGVCLLAYPTVSDWWNVQHASSAVSGYARAVEELSAEDYDRVLSDARAYNKDLAQHPTGFMLSDVQLAAYERQLAVDGTNVMGYLEIDRIDARLPIYHGTEDGVLQAGVGHLAGSSLPAGGPSTHAVLVGHRGLPSARLLTDLDKLEIGDVFSIAVLNEKLYYEVDQILIVEPTDLGALGIEDGEDLCTLVTCTPYGVNTHRLLVRGHRIDGPDTAVHLTADAVLVEPALVACVVALPMLVVLTVAVLLRSRRAR